MADGERSEPRRANGAGTAVPLEVIPLHSTNLLTVLDADGIIQYESPAIERIFGYAPEALVGEQVADYFHPDDREAVVAAFQTVVESDAYTVEVIEYRHEHADGSYRWVESVAAANPTPNGNYVINTRDIAARKARERELERTNERLDEFASIVSHDLRNPLTIATGRLQLAREECDSAHLDAVARAHDRMDGLIENLLAFARAGTGATEPEPVDLAGIIEASWRDVETADATLVADVDRVVRADEPRLRQLFENVFRNAVEHAGETVTVTVGELPDGAGLFIEDDGPGLPDPDEGTVFDSGYSTREAGTGLGLAIVAQVADAHDWAIDATTGAAGGARFELAGVDFVE